MQGYSKLLAIGDMKGKLFILKIICGEHVNIAKEQSSLELLCYHFGHLGRKNVQKMMKNNIIDGMNPVSDETNSVCEACILGKQHRCLYLQGVAYLRYLKNVKEYNLYHVESRSFVCSRDVVFLKRKFHYFHYVHPNKLSFQNSHDDVKSMLKTIKFKEMKIM